MIAPRVAGLNAPVNGNGRVPPKPPAPKPPGLAPRSIDLSRVTPFEWAWQYRLLIGYLNLIVGDEGVGKGTLLAYLIARLTRGDLPGDLLGKPTRVLLVGDEDGFDNVWVPRLHAAGADLALVCDLPVAETGGLDIARDARNLRALLAEHSFGVIVFDQLLDNLGTDVDDWRAKSVRGAIAPLRRTIADLNLVAIAALHTNKSDADTFRRRLAGTQAFNALSRSSLLLAEHPEDPARRLVIRGKGNYSAPPPAVEFTMRADRLRLNGHFHEPTVVTDLRESDLTIADVLRPAAQVTSKADIARTIIRDELSDGDWHDATPIRAELAEAGLSDRGIVRAANDLGVERRRTNGFPSRNEWRLARGGALTGTTGTTGTTAAPSGATRASDASQTAPVELALLDCPRVDRATWGRHFLNDGKAA